MSLTFARAYFEAGIPAKTGSTCIIRGKRAKEKAVSAATRDHLFWPARPISIIASGFSESNDLKRRTSCLFVDSAEMHVGVVLLVLVPLLKGTAAQRPSPCKSVLQYEPMDKEQTDRWTGFITISSRDELEGIWLYISLDTPVNVLLNWFGESTSKNNKEFSIRNLDYVVKPNEVLKVKIQVIFNEADRIPSVARIRLNGKVICNGPQSPFIPRTTTSTTTTSAPEVSETDLSTQATTRGRPGPDFTDITANVQCGSKVPKGIGLILNGHPSDEGEWPWHVAIYRTGLQLVYICGGSLVDNEHIVTAAHCVTKERTNIVIEPETFTIQLGRTYLRKFSPNNQERGISKITIHPKYDPTYYHNDVAVLKLSKPAILTDYVRPVCLWDQGPNDSVIGKLGSVVGWGFTANKTITDVLQEVLMPVVDPLTCIYSNRDFFSKVTSPTTLCAGFRNGTSVCNGDSGGGMFFQKQTSNNDVVWQLRGLVSISLVLQKRFCDPYNYIVFTDLAHYYDWILDITA